MNPTARQPTRPRWPVLVAVLAPPLMVGAVLLPMLLSSEPTAQDLWVGEGDYGPTSSATPVDVQEIHDALHDIGAECLKTEPSVDIIRSDVDLIIAFAARYPVGRFPIDDETATASSLLLIAREAVKMCAPAEMQRIDAALEAL